MNTFDLLGYRTDRPYSLVSTTSVGFFALINAGPTVINVTVIEAVTATTSQDAVAPSIASVVEPTTAVSDVTSTKIVANYASEALTCSETQSSYINEFVLIDETSIANSNQFITGSIYNTQTQEVSTTQDAVSSNLLITLVIVESSGALETQTAVTFIVTEIVESSVVVATQNALISLIANLIEAVIAVDECNASGSIYNPLVSESGEAQVSLIVAGSTFTITMLESVLASDSYAGRLLWELINDIQNANWGNVSNSQNPVWSAINNAQNPNWVPINTFGTS